MIILFFFVILIYSFMYIHTHTYNFKTKKSLFHEFCSESNASLESILPINCYLNGFKRLENRDVWNIQTIFDDQFSYE
jgi:hypothetical protein